MTTIALTPEGEAYLARVREELADLPPDERDELLEDIESHLAEVTGEGSVPLAVRLGSAEEFAQELRVSAGLPARQPELAPSRFVAARSRLRGAAGRVPGWWPRVDARLLWQLGRGWLLAAAAAVVIGGVGGTSAWGHAHLWLPHPGFRGYGAVLALAGFVVFSLWLGRRAAAGRGIRLDRAASALAVIAIAPALWHFDSPPRDHWYSYTTISEAPPGLYLDRVPVTNIFAYDRDGKPLNDVLLFQQDGLPLRIGASGQDDPNRRYLVTRRSQRLYNSFPVRYFDPGTSQVTHPNAGPRVQIPDILTPPLDTGKP
jgi:HAAS domain-containing protein